MKLHLPGCRNKLMTKLLKLMRYEKHSRSFFLLSTRISSGFWWLMDSPGHIYASFRHNDLSCLINNSSMSQVLPWSSSEKHILHWDSSGKETRPNLHMSSYKMMEECLKNADNWSHPAVFHAVPYKVSPEIFRSEAFYFTQKLCRNSDHQQWPMKTSVFGFWTKKG